MLAGLYARPRAARPRRRKLLHWLLVCAVVTQIAFLGLLFRIWMFHTTVPIRFQWDVQNAWNKGTQALQIGPGFWSGIVAMYQPTRHTGIDYPPIRMYLATTWVYFCHHFYGPAVQRTDADTWPMLSVNFIMELAGAIGMYALCRLRCGWKLSLLAACCLWFNPAVVYGGWGWMQWDVWVLAPVLWGLWAYLKRYYFLCGALIGLGSMMKGQTLFIAPWFLVVGFFEPPIYALHARFRLPWLREKYQRAWRAAAAWAASMLLRMRMMLGGFALVTFIAVLPFTLLHSVDWFEVYHHQTHMVQNMTNGAWNFPLLLAQVYGWGNSGTVLTLPGFGHIFSFTLMTWLSIGFGTWVFIIALLSIRARNYPQILLAPAAVFAAMNAMLPGMQQRYPIWAAGFAAAAVCVGPGATVLFIIMTFLGLCNPLVWTLHGPMAPRLQFFIDRSGQDDSAVWLFCSIAMTCQIALLSRRKAPQPEVLSAPEHDQPRSGETVNGYSGVIRRAGVFHRQPKGPLPLRDRDWVESL